jgi:hypothetical protein
MGAQMPGCRDRPFTTDGAVSGAAAWHEFRFDRLTIEANFGAGDPGLMGSFSSIRCRIFQRVLRQGRSKFHLFRQRSRKGNGGFGVVDLELNFS